MLCRVAQIQLSMLFPLCFNRTLPSRPALHTLTGRRTSQCRRRASKFNPKHAGKNSNRHSQKTPPTEPTRPLPILPMVQCSPFHPGLHSHLPSLHVPCSLQRGWHALWSHPVPIQPSSHRQVPDTQTPWPPQSAAQISVGDRDTERKKDKKKRVGEDRREEEDVEGGGGVRSGWKKKTRRWQDKATRVEKKTNPGVIVTESRPRSTTLSDGSWKEIPAPHKTNPFWQYKSNKSITKKRHGPSRP